ncbi:MAG: flagellar biosynthetic protein FliQ [Paracoccaceae bacterium]|nr:MAG: flagellar biosynthetic protein FliQ [Alphaproteobacteria bacterium]GIX15471.1 MAG: flagellar biosynthetic protein FliQ [Paracoccaceae bacterium]
MLSQTEIFDLMQGTLWVTFLVCLPVLAAALIVGLAIGLFQALTSVQEMTLTFVPKLGAILVTYWIAMGFMTGTLTAFWHDRVLPAIAGAR